MILQLNPPIPVTTTSKGKGLAHFLIDYGMEHHLYWVIFCDSSEIWVLANTEVRADSNETWGRLIDKANCKHDYEVSAIDTIGKKTWTRCTKCGDVQARILE